MEGKASPAKKSGHSSAGCLCNKYERSDVLASLRV